MDEEGNTLKDPYQMAELLRKQYESTFSEIDEDLCLDNLFSHGVREEDREEDKEKEDDREKEKEEEDEISGG